MSGGCSDGDPASGGLAPFRRTGCCEANRLDSECSFMGTEWRPSSITGDAGDSVFPPPDVNPFGRRLCNGPDGRHPAVEAVVVIRVLILLALLVPLRALGAELKIATWNLDWLTTRPAGDRDLPADVTPRSEDDFSRLG